MNESSVPNPAWRRIVVEVFVIVGSILLAFSIDAWWDGRQDRSRANSYLDMLASDARQTLRNNETFGGRADSIDWAGARLVRAYYEAELAPRDSIQRWFTLAVGFWVVQPTLGTGEALVATGDLRLIHSDSIRAALPRYLTYMKAFDTFEQQWADAFRAAVADLERHVDIEQLRLLELSPTDRDSMASADALYSLPAGAIRSLPDVDVRFLVRDPDVHVILVGMNRAKERMRLQRTRMRQASEEFLELLEVARRP